MLNRRVSEPPMTEAEARRRLGEAYRILLDLAARRRAQAAAPTTDTTPTHTTEPDNADRLAA